MRAAVKKQPKIKRINNAGQSGPSKTDGPDFICAISRQPASAVRTFAGHRTVISKALRAVCGIASDREERSDAMVLPAMRIVP